MKINHILRPRPVNVVARHFRPVYQGREATWCRREVVVMIDKLMLPEPSWPQSVGIRRVQGTRSLNGNAVFLLGVVLVGFAFR